MRVTFNPTTMQVADPTPVDPARTQEQLAPPHYVLTGLCIR